MRPFIAFAFAMLSCASALASDFEDLSALLEGRYDNELQVFFEAEQKTPGATGRERRHIAIRKTGAGVFAVTTAKNEGLRDDAETKVWTLQPGGTSVSMSIDSTEDPSPGCTVRWARQGDAFKTISTVGCPDGAQVSLSLSKDGLEMANNGVAAGPDKFLRVRPFECWVAVLRGAKHGDSGKGANDADWFFKRGVWLQDQGGVAVVTTDENPSRDLRLRLRRVAWPSGPNRPSLTLYVMEPGEDRAVSYAWAEFDAGRLGLNLRWMQASCTHAPDKLWP